MTEIPPQPSASVIAAGVRAGETSARDVIERSLRAATAFQDRLNAFTLIDTERALDRARQIDAAVARGTDPGRLAGVPVAVKDLIDQEGMVTTRGSSLAVPPATTTAPCVAALEAEGAVVIGRTGLHEYAFGFSSENHWFGPVRNPWDPDLSPGGSSGGSGSAVGAGIVPIALGTDTGGSVRVPAALCGIVGLKVTQGRGSTRGVFPLAPSLDTVGPLGRTVGDVALAYAVIGAHDEADPWSAPQPVVEPGDPQPLASLSVGVPHPWVDDDVEGDVRTGFEAAIEALRSHGAAVGRIDDEVISPPGMNNASVYFEVATIHGARWREHPESYGPEVAKRVAASLRFDRDAYLEALQWRKQVRSAFQEALATFDVIATPSVGALRKRIGSDTIEIDGSAVSYRRPLSRFTALVNHAGLPALALPLSSDARPPPSLQLVGPAWSEHRLLEIGAGLEAAGIVTTPHPPSWTSDRPTV